MNKSPATAMPAMLSSDKQVASRRDFLTLAWKSLLGLSGLLGLGGLWRFLSYQPDPVPQTIFDLGPAEAFASNSLTTHAAARAVVLSTAAGFQSFSLVCPHLGCVVDVTPEGFTCPCHGSRFGHDGALQHGPAEQSLRPLQLEIAENGHLILNTSENP